MRAIVWMKDQKLPSADQNVDAYERARLNEQNSEVRHMNFVWAMESAGAYLQACVWSIKGDCGVLSKQGHAGICVDEGQTDVQHSPKKLSAYRWHLNRMCAIESAGACLALLASKTDNSTEY